MSVLYDIGWSEFSILGVATSCITCINGMKYSNSTHLIIVNYFFTFFIRLFILCKLVTDLLTCIYSFPVELLDP